MQIPTVTNNMNPIEILATVARAESHRFVGRLGVEPEVRFLQSGSSVANARMAINHPDAKRDDKDKTDWFKVELWNEEAQAFADGAHKGDLVEVWGRVKTEQYTTRDGEQRTSLIIKPDSWQVLRRAGEAPGAAPAATARPAAPAAAQTWQSQYDADEVPF